MTTKVLFLGSKQLGLRMLSEMLSIDSSALIGVITIDDRADIRSIYKDFVTFCDEKKLPLHVAKNRRHSEQLIRELEPDICFVAGWYWLIGTETLQAVPQGFVGIHNSLLPKYRGSSPLIWTMINGEATAGFSIFSITEGMDEGAIWATSIVPIGETDGVGDILQKLESETVNVMRRLYPQILDGSIEPREQIENEVSYCSPRFEFDGEIDWNWSARKVYNFIRAQSEPYPGAFTYFNGEKLTIWKARLNDAVYYGTPGQVARIGGTVVYVICGDSRSIILEVVELNGSKTKASETIKSVKTRFPK